MGFVLLLGLESGRDRGGWEIVRCGSRFLQECELSRVGVTNFRSQTVGCGKPALCDLMR